MVDLLKTNGNLTEAWKLLLALARSNNNLKEAAVALSEINRLAPSATSLFDEALIAHQMQRSSLVVKTLACIELSEISSEKLALNVGAMLTQYDQLERANRLFAFAVKRWPNNHALLAEHAQQCLFAGDFDTCTALLDTLILAPETSARALFLYSELPKRFWRDDLGKLIDLTLSSVAIDDEPRLLLAKYRVLESQGEFEKAFSSLRKANEAQRKRISDRRRIKTANSQRLIDFFKAQKSSAKAEEQVFAKSANIGQGTTPIFVIGLPRSGTTLTEQILSSHSQISGLGELPQFARLIKRALSIHQQHGTEINWSLVGESYLSEVAKLSDGAAFIVDKMPLNYQLIGFIRLCLPQAKIVLVERDAADVCFSQYRQIFADDAVAMDHSYRLPDLAEHYREYRKTVSDWLSLCGNDVHVLKYESLVGNLEQEIHSLLNYLGLTVEDGCLAFHQSQRRVSTASAGQIREGINADAVARWRCYEDQLGPLFGLL